jgi:hypothetical protein
MHKPKTSKHKRKAKPRLKPSQNNWPLYSMYGFMNVALGGGIWSATGWKIGDLKQPVNVEMMVVGLVGAIAFGAMQLLRERQTK